MKSPKQGRFEGHQAPREPASSEGPALLLDVDGHVTYDGDAPRTVTVAGVTHSFDDRGHVSFGGRTYQLVRVKGRESLSLVASAG